MSSDLVSSIAALATPVVINAVIAWLMINWVWFASQDPQLQKLIKAGIAIVMSLVSYGLLQLIPANVFAQLQPIWALLYNAIIGVFGAELTTLLIQWRAAERERFGLEELKALVELGVTLDAATVQAIFPRRTNAFHTTVATAKRPGLLAGEPLRTALAGVAGPVNPRPPLPEGKG